VHFDDVDDPLPERAGRAEAICHTALAIDADILCLQEVASSQGKTTVTPSFLAGELRTQMRAFGWVSPEGSAEQSTSNPILYRRDRFLPVRQGIQWYSDAPLVPDTADWGNTIPRYAVWALFYDARSGGHLLVINTHLDHRSVAANRRAAEQLVALAHSESGGEPTVIAGDFNAPRFGDVQGNLACCFTRVLEAADGSTFRGIPLMQIDEIFVSEDVTVVSHAVIDPRADGKTSDHRPLVADLELPPGDSGP
jgi:endonuclease/exonuclease/phosphatase family metal-dependent hydrolase